MNVNKPIDQPTTTRKRRQESKDSGNDDGNDDDEHGKRRALGPAVEQADVRFDFLAENDASEEQGDVSDLLGRLGTIKQQLNEVKSLLSDKDIAEWNSDGVSLVKHTAYMNVASTIVPYVREKLDVEVGTQAWAKMFEILANFPLIDHVKDQTWITLHLCEAPGAFISALNHFLVTREETQHLDWQWHAQTLNPYYEHDELTIPMLIDDDRLIFHTIDGDHWDFGIHNTGNIMSRANIDYYVSRFQPMGVSLITADGSFDVQDNPGEQEHLVNPLLKTEVYVALSCLKAHGNFVLKLFTVFEQITIDLVHVLYRTFRQISMFKPKTSKRGNSEMYVICTDFQRDHFAPCFTDDQQVNRVPYSSLFLNQLLQCAQFFQSHQISTIEHNLYSFQNLNRRSTKKLHKRKEQTLDAFLHQCQVRQLLDSDRHLLKKTLPSEHIHLSNQRITRTGTFNEQHQIDANAILRRIQSGFFCLTCSKDERNELCPTCQTLCQMIDDSSVTPSYILIGPLSANSAAVIDCVYGKQSLNIRNSCFCHRYLLELCGTAGLSADFPLREEDLRSMRHSAATQISGEQLEQLQRFARNYQVELQSRDGVCYTQSSPILTRLQASVIYVLTRAFEHTSVYVIPSASSPHLLFLFETFGSNINEEYQTVEQQLVPSSTASLLQFVHIHQLLDQQFAFHLIQANHLCLQLKYATANIYSQLPVHS